VLEVPNLLDGAVGSTVISASSSFANTGSGVAEAAGAVLAGRLVAQPDQLVGDRLGLFRLSPPLCWC
jgi:hypothetical protein